VYRDYHAPTINGLRPFAIGGGAYDRDAAMEQARRHARDFVARVGRRADAYRAAWARPALVVCALDTELLGHWWYEGLAWLEAVFEQARAAGLRLATLPEALERHPPAVRPLVESSWGQGKSLRTWDSPAVAELVWPARAAELRLVGALAGNRGNGSRAAAERAARELLALQSSDWAFMATRALAADYPERRVRNHSAAFEDALVAFHGAVKDFPAMPAGPQIEPSLRGLAPALDIAALIAPTSPWGR
jgi:1,4-alpha-glucan branching enzyme